MIEDIGILHALLDQFIAGCGYKYAYYINAYAIFRAVPTANCAVVCC